MAALGDLHKTNTRLARDSPPCAAGIDHLRADRRTQPLGRRVLSNGPATYTADHVVALPARCWAPESRCSRPFRQIQILPRAGLPTYKMVFGHRGNIPVVRPPPVGWRDRAKPLRALRGRRANPSPPRSVLRSATPALTTVWSKALLSVDGRAFSVHTPEAAAGPHDAEYPFDQPVELMVGEGR